MTENIKSKRSMSESNVITDDSGEYAFPSGYYNEQKVDEIYSISKSYHAADINGYPTVFSVSKGGSGTGVDPSGYTSFIVGYTGTVTVSAYGTSEIITSARSTSGGSVTLNGPGTQTKTLSFKEGDTITLSAVLHTNSTATMHLTWQ